MIERLIKSLIVFISKNFFIKQVFGIENLPKKGPYIIVPNHSSYFDHFFIFTVVNYYMKQQVLFLTKKRSF